MDRCTRAACQTDRYQHFRRSDWALRVSSMTAIKKFRIQEKSTSLGTGRLLRIQYLVLVDGHNLNVCVEAVRHL